MSDTTCRSDECTVCLTEYDSVRVSFDPCAVELSIDGGGDNFSCYTDMDVDASVFEGGNFWEEGWHIASNPFGLIAVERWESYPSGTAGILDNDLGWEDSAWDIDEGIGGEIARETFEDYTSASGMDSGTGFSATAWHVETNA